MSAWRSDFPALQGEGAYLDSAATAHKPQCVIDTMGELLGPSYATISRGLYKASQDMTARYENARHVVAQFIKAEDDEIVFTRNATEALNIVAHGLKAKRVLITEMEHHANIVPWQMTGAQINVLPITSSGELNVGELDKFITKDTNVFSFTAASNVLGTVNDVHSIIKTARSINRDIIIVLDASQAAVHMPIDVKAWDCDFLVFTGHKLYGPTGVGVLFGKAARLTNLPPLLGGGDMVDTVTFEKTTYRDAPHKFEAGTPNFIEAIALGEAIHYMSKIGWAALHAHESKIRDFLFTTLANIDGVEIVGHAPERLALASFAVKRCHPQDLAMILDQMNIAVRVGHHCAMPLLQRLGHKSLVRASAGLYTNEADIAMLEEGLKKAGRMLT